MTPPIERVGDKLDPFKLHYVRNGQRCVVSYDTFDEALSRAIERLESRQDESVWISDAGNHPLLDPYQIRSRWLEMRGTEPSHALPPPGPLPDSSSPHPG